MRLSERQTDALIRALKRMIDASRKSDLTALIMQIDAARQQAEAALVGIKPRPTRAVTTDPERELYIIPDPTGYTCLGFDVLLARYNAIAAWLRSEGLQQDDLPLKARGSIRTYTHYRTLMDRAAAYCHRNNLRCPAELTPQLVNLEGKRVEVVDRHGNRRRFIVGRSTGWLPCHLEIPRRDSHGSPAVSSAPFQSVHVIRA